MLEKDKLQVIFFGLNQKNEGPFLFRELYKNNVHARTELKLIKMCKKQNYKEMKTLSFFSFLDYFCQRKHEEPILILF